MTEKQLFYPLLSVYFSLILGDLQKEKLQIVSIFRFGHKKRGLFQCPREGRGGATRQQRQLCRSCDYTAQGCGHGPLPWVAAPLILLLCKSCV